MKTIQVWTIGALIGAVAVAAATAPPPQAAKSAGVNHYIGAAKCKMCHATSDTGDQFGKWKLEKHAKAFETLAGDAAKKLGKEKGVDDPQKADQCMKCHATAWSEPAEHLAKGFDKNLGVQCETCHGPGEKHMKARLAAAAAAGDDTKAAPRQEVPKDELVAFPEMTVCTGCHNKESPSYKPFCFKKRLQDVAHLDPRDAKAAEALKNAKCDCDECKKAGGP
jgi:hypothetical protein